MSPPSSPATRRMRRREAPETPGASPPPAPVPLGFGMPGQYTNRSGPMFAVRESRAVSGRRRRGFFVTFEGIEGSGKSTQVARLAGKLRALRVPHLTTREPGGTAIGASLRGVLLGWPGRLDPAAELLLLFADRKQDLAERIEPALAAGRVVLCDRYTDASRAYQGAGRGLGEAAVDALHERFCRREPDVTYLFDCPVETALGRVARRGRGTKDRFEREAFTFHRRVRAAYRRRARREPRRFVVLDARGSADEVFAGLWADFARRLMARGFLPRGASR